MATTINFQSASAHTLTLLNSSDDGVATSVARATVLAACHEGPLKALLTRTANWTVFNLGGPLSGKISVRALINRGAGPEPTSSEFYWEAAAIKCNLPATYIQQIEIRLAHSSRA